jgi:sugar lactone lactonase YvrE
MMASRRQETTSEPIEVGEGAFRYRVVEDWLRLPVDCDADRDFVEVAAMATDSQGRVYVFNRGRHPVTVFTAEGDLLGSWGEGLFTRAHGMTICPDIDGPGDTIYCVDDLDHTIKKFSTDGQLLQTLGVSGQFSDTGATTVDYRNIRRSGPPFNFPTNIALSAAGDIYVTDGYGNARVHKFSADGQLILSWGDPGSGPGQFHVPHGIAIDSRGLVYVADRENSRIQRFTKESEYVDEWNDVARPCEVFIDSSDNVYVAELGYRAGMWPGTTAPHPGATGGRVSIFGSDGKRLARWGGGDTPCAAGDFFAPHDIWMDARGDLYVSEVTVSAGGNQGLVSADCHTLQKFAKLPEPEHS